MKKRITVTVLMGGKSAEHEISLISGREVVKNLNFKKYNVLPIVISRNGITWQIGERAAFLLDSPAKRRVKGKKPKVGKLIKTDHVSIIKNHKVDVVFIAMHGPNGEDGTIQGFLELIGVPYTGSGILASALGMDKISSRKLFTQAGLKVPEYLVLQKDDSPQIVWQKFEPPVFVKPHNQGSSVGTTLVKKKGELKDALDLAFSFSHLSLVEEFINGVEIPGPPPVSLFPKSAAAAGISYPELLDKIVMFALSK